MIIQASLVFYSVHHFKQKAMSAEYQKRINDETIEAAETEKEITLNNTTLHKKMGLTIDTPANMATKTAGPTAKIVPYPSHCRIERENGEPNHNHSQVISCTV